MAAKKKTETAKPTAIAKIPTTPPIELLHEFQGVHSQMPCSIELTRNAKGIHTWTLKAYGATFDDCLSQIEAANRKLQVSFGQTEQ